MAVHRGKRGSVTPQGESIHKDYVTAVHVGDTEECIHKEKSPDIQFRHGKEEGEKGRCFQNQTKILPHELASSFTETFSI